MYDPSRVNKIATEIGEFLRMKLPKDPVELVDHLISLDALRFELLTIKVDWQLLLAEKKNQMLHPKDKEFTEMDRKIMLNASIGNIERDYEFLLGLEKLVESRLSLGELVNSLIQMRSQGNSDR